jgi:hypothetical protein
MRRAGSKTGAVILFRPASLEAAFPYLRFVRNARRAQQQSCLRAAVSLEWNFGPKCRPRLVGLSAAPYR